MVRTPQGTFSTLVHVQRPLPTDRRIRVSSETIWGIATPPVPHRKLTTTCRPVGPLTGPGVATTTFSGRESRLGVCGLVLVYSFQLLRIFC